MVSAGHAGHEIRHPGRRRRQRRSRQEPRERRHDRLPCPSYRPGALVGRGVGAVPTIRTPSSSRPPSAGLGSPASSCGSNWRSSRSARPDIDVETLELSDLDAFFSAQPRKAVIGSTRSPGSIVSPKGSGLGRGLFMRGRHQPQRRAARLTAIRVSRCRSTRRPGCSTASTVRLFNSAYRHRPWALGARTVHYDPFFLSARRGARAGTSSMGRAAFSSINRSFRRQAAIGAMQRLLDLDRRAISRVRSLSCSKLFGDRKSPGLLSFPMAGRDAGARSAQSRARARASCLQAMTDVVMEAGGRVYPAKDATMSAEAFRSRLSRLDEIGSIAGSQYHVRLLAAGDAMNANGGTNILDPRRHVGDRAGLCAARAAGGANLLLIGRNRGSLASQCCRSGGARRRRRPLMLLDLAGDVDHDAVVGDLDRVRTAFPTRC